MTYTFSALMTIHSFEKFNKSEINALANAAKAGLNQVELSAGKTVYLTHFWDCEDNFNFVASTIKFDSLSAFTDYVFSHEIDVNVIYSENIVTDTISD